MTYEPKNAQDRIAAEDRLRLLASSVPKSTKVVQVSVDDIRAVLETMDLAIAYIAKARFSSAD